MILMLFDGDDILPYAVAPCYNCGDNCLHGYCSAECEIAGEGLTVCDECMTVYSGEQCPECSPFGHFGNG